MIFMKETILTSKMSPSCHTSVTLVLEIKVKNQRIEYFKSFLVSQSFDVTNLYVYLMFIYGMSVK